MVKSGDKFTSLHLLNQHCKYVWEIISVESSRSLTYRLIQREGEYYGTSGPINQWIDYDLNGEYRILNPLLEKLILC